MSNTTKTKDRSKFPPLYWLVVMFEFFERGSYYGMMSVLSVYLVDELQFAKQDVGLIKGTIQPLLYFLPILSGALADRFGYRRMLMIAFSLLGGGYFLTSQATGYAPVFLSLVVMGLGAGTFKPIVSGTIARCTDESNSTLGFGIFYWSINLGAFLFPLILVPLLRDNIGYEWVIIASAIGTGAMLLPTIFAFREPPKAKDEEQQLKQESEKPGLFQTIANAFEIIYSPVVLLALWMTRSGMGKVVTLVTALVICAYGAWSFSSPAGFTKVYSARLYQTGDKLLEIRVERNMCSADSFKVNTDKLSGRTMLTVVRPDEIGKHIKEVKNRLESSGHLSIESSSELIGWIEQAGNRVILDVVMAGGENHGAVLRENGSRLSLIVGNQGQEGSLSKGVFTTLAADARTAVLNKNQVVDLLDRAGKRPFLILFIGLLFLAALIVQRLSGLFKKSSQGMKFALISLVLTGLYLPIWVLPDLSLFARILTSVLSLTVISLFAISYEATERFTDHLKFLVMIAIYSGFWIMYFQMFDSVLWYVQAYVDPAGLNHAINTALAAVGIESNWRFDVEGVTYINAGTIIALQLMISAIVKKTKALPTMIVGIMFATIGMAILSISTGIWVFMAGIIIFSVGEMTAHPKFISYVGQTAPKARVAMYMGYLFLYGVFGSSVGGVLGANLYVKFVDEMNQPRTLWLIFAGIGVMTVVGLLVYNALVTRKDLRTP